MLRQVSNRLLRRCYNASLTDLSYFTPSTNLQQTENFASDTAGSIKDSWERSCFNKIDYTISEELSMYDAVQKFAAFDVGALVAINSKGNLSGLISERDYVKKIALLGRTSKETKIKDVYTNSANLVTVTVNDSIDSAMQKMVTKSVRHLPIVDGDQVVGLVSIKDLIKAVVQDKEEKIKALSDFALGKGSI